MFKEENKNEADTMLIHVEFVEGQLSYFLEFSIDYLRSYHF